MRKNRFSEAQIIGMIKEQEAGMSTAVRPVRPDFRCQCKTCDERIHTMRRGCVETALMMAHRRAFCVQLDCGARSSFSYHIGLWRRVRAILGTS